LLAGSEVHVGSDEQFREQRRFIRLEVRGEISARLVGRDLPLVLRNLSKGGFLAEAGDSLPIGSLQTIQLSAKGGLAVLVTARCAHCREFLPCDAPRYALGFAFMVANPAAIDALLDRLMASITSTT
jgi:hypothetical protein